MNELDLAKLRQELTTAERKKNNAEDALKLLIVFDDNLAIFSKALLDLQAAAAEVELLKQKIATVKKK